MIYLTRNEIVRVHDIIIRDTGGLEGVLNEHTLLMLETQPAQYVFGKELYPGIFKKAALYARVVNGGHIFVDGNKRTSITIVSEFLRKNSYIFEPPEKRKELEDFTIRIAENLLDLEQIAIWIEKYSRKK